MWRMPGLLVLVALIPLYGYPPASFAQGEAAVERIETARHMLRDPELGQRDPDRVRNEILLLGRLRAVEAVPDLVRLLGFRYKYRWEKPVDGVRAVVHPIDVGDRYPAIAALFEIGKPALPGLLEVVEIHEFSSIESKNARRTMREIFRDEPSKADELFTQAAAKAPSPKACDRLLRALQSAAEDMKLGKEDL